MVLSESPRIELICADCMDILPMFADKQWELAIVDPPYGDKCDLKGGSARHGTHGWSGKLAKAVDKWNKKPDKLFFNKLFNISKNQIIFGGNYFIEDIAINSSCWIIWDKGQREFSLADGEMAWTSFKSSIRIFTYSRGQAIQEGKIHPTQKPIALYRWLIQNYAQPGDKILDTHLGSGSSAIAAYREGHDFLGIEKDIDYFNAAVERFKRETSQVDIFQNRTICTEQMEAALV